MRMRSHPPTETTAKLQVQNEGAEDAEEEKAKAAKDPYHDQ